MLLLKAFVYAIVVIAATFILLWLIVSIASVGLHLFGAWFFPVCLATFAIVGVTGAFYGVLKEDQEHTK